MGKKKNDWNSNVIEAMETLSDIADLNIDEEGIIELPKFKDIDEENRTFEWLKDPDIESRFQEMGHLFDVIFKYLKGRFKREAKYTLKKKTIDGIKNIMVVVGEAAKKFDRMMKVRDGTCKLSVTELKEFKRLQTFYQKKVEKKVDESVLSRWIFGLAKQNILGQEKFSESGGMGVDSEHVFVDLDSVKKDIDYELLLLRKRDGKRFYNPKLLRNLKLVCDFGLLLEDGGSDDPLDELDLWQSRICSTTARNILHAVKREELNFYRVCSNQKNRDIVAKVNSSLVALKMAADPHRLLKREDLKRHFDYFSDFISYLRGSLSNHELQKWMTFAPKKRNQFASTILALVHGLCNGIYTCSEGMQEVIFRLDDLLHEARELSASIIQGAGKRKRLWTQVEHDYACMLHMIKNHSTAPLLKIVDILEHSYHSSFDSLAQKNIPNKWFTFYPDGKGIDILRMPSPTVQYQVHEANLNAEFKGFLQHSSKKGRERRLLLFNLQDNTSWKEFARADCLEKAQHLRLFKDTLDVVTLAVDTDFYHQINDYATRDGANDFIDEFYTHLDGQGSGFYFPPNIQKQIFPAFAKSLLKGIHKMFFQSKKKLDFNERISFISIVYLFLELKIIESCQSDYVSFTCKDGLDLSSMHTGLLFAFCQMLEGKSLSEAAKEYLNLIIYGPCLAVRERAPLSKVMERFIEGLKTIEELKRTTDGKKFQSNLQKTFGKLFKGSVFTSRIEMVNVQEEINLQ